MNRDALKEKILTAQSCLVLETTNKLSQVGRKVWELREGRRFVIRQTGRTPYAGLVYCRTKARLSSDFGLDVIAKVDGFEHDIALAALEYAYENSYSKSDARVAEEFWLRVVDGEPLDRLIYVTSQQWDAFREKYPNLLPDANSAKEYRDKTCNTKGTLVQAYVQTAIRAQQLDVDIIPNYEYHAKKGKMDIDLIVLGEKQKVLSAIGNRRYFKPVKQSKEVKKASRRLRTAC